MWLIQAHQEYKILQLHDDTQEKKKLTDYHWWFLEQQLIKLKINKGKELSIDSAFLGQTVFQGH